MQKDKDINISYYDELTKIEGILVKQLSEIRRLKNIYDTPIVNSLLSANYLSGVSYEAKGDKTWEEYILRVLTIIGGQGRSKDVYQYIIDANRDFTISRVKTVVVQQLSKLANAGYIESEQSKNRKLGFIYKIIDRPFIEGQTVGNIKKPHS
ncbi:hypothetical protein GYB57_04560 [bacterium]|nr:hypothetical protein [bacterium]